MSLSSTANLSLSQINKAMRINTAGNIGIGTTNVNTGYKLYVPSATVYSAYVGSFYVGTNYSGFNSGYYNSTYITTIGTYYIDLTQYNGFTSLLSVQVQLYNNTMGQAWCSTAAVMYPYNGNAASTFRPYLTNIYVFGSGTSNVNATLAPYAGGNTTSGTVTDSSGSARLSVTTLSGPAYINWQITTVGYSKYA